MCSSPEGAIRGIRDRWYLLKMKYRRWGRRRYKKIIIFRITNALFDEQIERLPKSKTHHEQDSRSRYQVCAWR